MERYLLHNLGRWSDSSDVWSEELRTQLKQENADDGLFWINI